MSKKIGRNDDCSCGSGKKYKKCCINSENTFKGNSSIEENSSIFINFNTLDLIKIFSGLTLLPENHGKNIRFEELTRLAASSINESEILIQKNNLQAYLNTNYPSHYEEDPFTNLFTDLITFYGGDFIIFPGITDAGNYVLSNQLIAIYNWPGSGISQKFRSNCRHASLLILNLSNAIAQRLGYHRYMSAKVEESFIFIPNTSRLDELKSAVTFSESEMQILLEENSIAQEALSLFVCDLNDPAIGDKQIDDSPFLVKPIIHHDHEYIIASPATLSYALVEFIKSEAKLSDEIHLLNNAYHNLIWNYLQLYLGQLGFSAIQNLELSNNPDPEIRDRIYRFDDDKLAYVQYDSTGSFYNQGRKQRIINEILALHEFEGHHFMDITLVSAMGRDLIFAFQRTNNSLSIGMPIYDLDTLVKLKKHTALDLWKFALATESI